MDESNKKELLKKAESYRHEISSLRVDLNKINEEKESWFDKKQQAGKKIKELLKKASALKKERDSITSQIKTKKEGRKDSSELINKKIAEFKELSKKRDDIEKRYNIKGSPESIKEDIKKIEFKIETDAISFEKEKELMKHIKILKKKYEELKAAGDIWKKAKELSREIDELKKNTSQDFDSVQENAKIGQQKHEEMMSILKEVDALRDEEKKYHEKASGFKAKFSEINNALQEKLIQMNKLSEELLKYKIKSRELRKIKEETLLKTRESIIAEKMKKGGKLTTEDLLLIQSMDK